MLDFESFAISSPSSCGAACAVSSVDENRAWPFVRDLPPPRIESDRESVAMLLLLTKLGGLFDMLRSGSGEPSLGLSVLCVLRCAGGEGFVGDSGSRCSVKLSVLGGRYLE